MASALDKAAVGGTVVVSGNAGGGGFEGASRIDRGVAGWYPNHGSADAVLIPEKELMDARGNDALRNDSLVSAGIRKAQDSIIGPRYRLLSKPNWRALPKMFDERWAEEFQEEYETKFTLYAESTNCWIDAAGKLTFSDLLRLAVGPSYMVHGEVLGAAEWLEDRGRPYSTAIQLVDPMRLSTPPGFSESRYMRAGLEKSRSGRVVRYWIRNSHPNDLITDWESATWSGVWARKPWGRKNILFVANQVRTEQSRGVSQLAAGLKPLWMRRKLGDLELQNVALNAMYAAVLETDLPEAVASSIIGEAESGTQSGAYEAVVQKLVDYLGGKALMLDGVKVPVVPPGTHMKMQRATSSGNDGFSFERSLDRHLARIFGMSVEEFTGDFTETNYSSARAAMGETHRYNQAQRATVADKLATDIASLWLEEALRRGDIQSMPVGWHWGMFYQGLNREALTQCQWLGAPRPEIDPLKEAQADGVKLVNKTATFAAVCAKNGEDWREVIDQVAREQDYANKKSVSLDYVGGKVSAGVRSDPDEEPRRGDGKFGSPGNDDDEGGDAPKATHKPRHRVRAEV